jgi:putative membrane protein
MCVAVQSFETRDAMRRTRLANERTYLAWWRSGLTALAVALGAGKLLPEVAGGAAWPYEVVGAGYALLGVAFIGYGQLRQTKVERALARDEFSPMDARVAVCFATTGIALAVATIALLFIE